MKRRPLTVALGLTVVAVLFVAFASEAEEAAKSDVAAGDEPWPAPDESYACRPVGHAAGAFLAEIDRSVRKKVSERTRLDSTRTELEVLKKELAAETARLAEKIDAWDKRQAAAIEKEKAAAKRQREKDQEEGQAKLAKAISKMNALSGAAVLTGLERPLAANLLRRMPPQQAGSLLAAMNPQTAARLTTTAIEGDTP